MGDHLSSRQLMVDSAGNESYRAEGIIKNTNTIEDYRALDKSVMLNQVGKTVSSSV